MREILFRGKSCVGGWVYGYLKKQMVGDKADVWAIQTEIPESEKPMFVPPTSKQEKHTTRLYENVVVPATIGQCTGFKDHNGKLVFECDILEDYDNGIDTGGLYVVSWDSKVAGFYAEFTDSGERVTLADVCVSSDGMVIGNIYDNPELLPHD
ncbi:hypothetical protein FACS189490_14220 [Clostridia bacterium]|nr:hypothetical protein FACS189490_14220 [Clostridia bacterium]